MRKFDNQYPHNAEQFGFGKFINNWCQEQIAYHAERIENFLPYIKLYIRGLFIPKSSQTFVLLEGRT